MRKRCLEKEKEEEKEADDTRREEEKTQRKLCMSSLPFANGSVIEREAKVTAQTHWCK